MGRICNSLTECRQKLSNIFYRLRTLEPPLDEPTVYEVTVKCRGEYRKIKCPGEKGVHLRIIQDYPHHPATICTPSRDGRNHLKKVDFADVYRSDVIVLAGMSIFGNGDDHKWIEYESKAGFAFVSLSPLFSSEEAAYASPNYSPLRSVSTVLSRDGEWSEALQEVAEVTKAMTIARGHTIPTPTRARFPYIDRESRFWGVCEAGRPEVELVLNGAIPTRPPDETPNSTDQCELGAWWQSYEYNDRPIVALDDKSDGFPSNTKYLAIRALESNPTAFIQGAIEVARLKKDGEVTLVHEALDPWNVTYIWGNKPNEIAQARRSSLFTITFRYVAGRRGARFQKQ